MDTTALQHRPLFDAMTAASLDPGISSTSSMGFDANKVLLA